MGAIRPGIGGKMTAFTVASQTQLDSALTQIKGGDTIQLAAGVYSLTMASKAFTSNVTITSLDAANPARLSWLKLTDTSNVTFKNLEVGRALGSTETTDAVLAKVTNGGNITFDTVHFHGSLDNDPKNDGTGINFGAVNGLTVINSEFEQLGRGATFGACRNVVVSNNSFHDIRSDGIDFAAMSNVLIDGNSFTNFYPTSTDHPDAIQFWTANTTWSSTDIVIRNNVILQGNGSGMQGIFLRDDVGGLPYQRVTIENNLIYERNMSNGITVMGGGIDVTITGNTVLSPSGDGIPVWIRAENIQGGTITKNLTDQFYLGTNTNLTVTDNLLTSQSGLSSSLLSLSNLSTMDASKLLVSGYGYTPPSTSGSTTTDPTTDTTTTTTTTTTTSDPTTTTTGTSGTGTTSGDTTTTTKPGKGKGHKSLVVTRVAVDATSYDFATYGFGVSTLSDALPEIQSGHGSLSTSSVFKPRSGSNLTKARNRASRFAAEALVGPSRLAGLDYRLVLFGSH